MKYICSYKNKASICNSQKSQKQNRMNNWTKKNKSFETKQRSLICLIKMSNIYVSSNTFPRNIET